MFDRTYYATHPDMMECVSNEELRDRYLIPGLFRAGECVLNYTHADRFVIGGVAIETRSEEHTSELQSLMRISYAVFCLKKKTTKNTPNTYNYRSITQPLSSILTTHQQDTPHYT